MSMYKVHYKMSNGEEYDQYFDLEVMAYARVAGIKEGEFDWLYCYDQSHKPTGIINVNQIVSMKVVKIV